MPRSRKRLGAGLLRVMPLSIDVVQRLRFPSPLTFDRRARGPFAIPDVSGCAFSFHGLPIHSPMDRHRAASKSTYSKSEIYRSIQVDNLSRINDRNKSATGMAATNVPRPAFSKDARRWRLARLDGMEPPAKEPFPIAAPTAPTQSDLDSPSLPRGGLSVWLWWTAAAGRFSFPCTAGLSQRTRRPAVRCVRVRTNASLSFDIFTLPF